MVACVVTGLTGLCLVVKSYSSLKLNSFLTLTQQLSKGVSYSMLKRFLSRSVV